MKAVKSTVSIKVEVLSVDSVPSLLFHMIEQLKAEYITGELSADDGDSVSWSIVQTEVEF